MGRILLIIVTNLLQVDLNLLTVLDALLRERHVSRAGLRVGLSQPATSAALARLRTLFDDQLLERDGNQMRLTARALELREPLAAVLASLSSLFDDRAQFDPATAQGTFRIAATDYVITLLAADLEAAIEASGSTLCIEWHPVVGIQQRLDEDRLQLAVGTFESLPGRFRREPLLHEELVCVMRKGHPALASAPRPGDTVPLAEYLAYRHLRVSPRNDDLGSVTRRVSELREHRPIGCIVHDFMAAPYVLASTSLIASLPLRVVRNFEGQLALEVRNLPLALQPRVQEMMWHERRETTPLDLWIRETLRSSAARLESRVGMEPVTAPSEPPLLSESST